MTASLQVQLECIAVIRKPLFCLLTTIQGGNGVTFEKIISSLDHHFLNIQNLFCFV